MSIKTSRPGRRAPPPQPSSSPRAIRDDIRPLRQDGTHRGLAAAGWLAPATAAACSPAAARTRLHRHRRRPAQRGHTPRPPDAGGTRLRLRALHVMGHGSARIARAVGADPTTIRDLVRGDATTISPRLRDAITAVYDAWWDKRAPRTHPQRTRRSHTRPQTRHHRELVRRRRPRRRPARHPRLPAPLGLETRHRHRHRPRHLPARTPEKKERHMADDERFTWGFILEVLDVLERHGYPTATTSTPARPSDSFATWPASTKAR